MNRDKPKLVLTTCGTSILTNEAAPEKRKLITYCANKKGKDLSKEEKSELDQHIEERRQMLEEANAEQLKRLSAEFNGLLSYFGDHFGLESNTPDLHILIVSDTYLGKKVGELIESRLRSEGFSDVRTWSPGGLITSDRDDFRHAMSDLVKLCEDSLPGHRGSGYHIAFNLTGGFKSIQGFMQTLGMFYADEMFYIFETGSLLTIPRLPVRLDAEAAISHYGQCFRRLGAGEELTLQECGGISEVFLFHDGEKATLSEWGQLIWERSKKEFYGKELLAPLPDIDHGPQFARQVEKQNLTPNLMATLNQRLDELSLVVRSRRDNLSSLDFKPLKGNPKPPSTHECDIWSGDERRLFGHYEGDVFVVDGIERGLH